MLAVKEGESKVWFVLLCPNPEVAASPPPRHLCVSVAAIAQRGHSQQGQSQILEEA